MSLYKNPMLGERVAKVVVVDRFICGITATFEQVFSLSIQTDAHSGLVGIVLALDMVAEGQTHGSTPLAMYPLSQQPDAEADARLLALKYGLTLRKAHTGVGWIFLQACGPEHPLADAELRIGV